MGRSVSRQRVIVRQSYYWPDQQLNFWIIIMLATGGVLIGVFAMSTSVFGAWYLILGILPGGCLFTLF